MKRTIYRCMYRFEGGRRAGRLCKEEVYRPVLNSPVEASRYCINHEIQFREEKRKQRDVASAASAQEPAK